MALAGRVTLPRLRPGSQCETDGDVGAACPPEREDTPAGSSAAPDDPADPLPPLSIHDAQALRQALAESIQDAVTTYEEATGLTVEDIDLVRVASHVDDGACELLVQVRVAL